MRRGGACRGSGGRGRRAAPTRPGRPRPPGRDARWLARRRPGAVVAGVERDREVSDAFRVEVSPHVFVIDEGDAVVAQVGAVTLADVEALVRGAQGIQIVPGATGG